MSATATYWQRGEALDYTNDGDDTIEAGTVIILGSRIAVAGCEIESGDTGTIHVTGVFYFPKSTEEAIDAGTELYYSDTDGVVTATASDVVAGYACAAAAETDSTVLVKINA